MFIIREMNMSDTANFLGSANMWSIAEQNGLWQPGQPQDFTATFSDGEYAHKYYTGRRVWGAYRLLAPSANLSPSYDNLKNDAPYPFSLKPDEKLTVEHFTKVHREWYEGTEYSTSVGLAGGPFGTPDRYSGGAGEQEVQGNWERTIALFRTSQTYVVQSRGWLPSEIGGVVWFGPHAPHGTVFVPFPTGMTSLPHGYSNGWQGEFDRSCAFWAHRAVLNLAQIKFSYIIDDIRAKQQYFESRSLDLLAALENSAATDREKITASFVENAEDVVREWWRLFDAILFKYADGYINSYDGKRFTSVSVGYPAWWLEQVGYQNGPPPV
jgi:dipeptidase